MAEQGAVDAAEANKQTLQAKIASLLPSQKARAEAALALAQVELDKTVVHAGVAGTIQQFALQPGDIVNTMIRPAGILVPAQAGREQLIAGFNQIEAQVMKLGMIAEVDLHRQALYDHPDGGDPGQDVVATGQLRPTDQLVDAQQLSRPGTITVFLRPLFAGQLMAFRLAAAASPTPTPTITTARNREPRDRAARLPARRRRSRACACHDPADPGVDAAGSDVGAPRPLTC